MEGEDRSQYGAPAASTEQGQQEEAGSMLGSVREMLEKKQTLGPAKFAEYQLEVIDRSEGNVIRTIESDPALSLELKTKIVESVRASFREERTKVTAEAQGRG